VPLFSRLSETAVTASRVFYLHGFTSSAQSGKADYFRQKLDSFGIPLVAPDFNEPDFRSLTMTRMLERLSDDLAATAGSAAVIGSSLGGTLAILAAARWPDRIDRLVLLAPAVMFARPGHHLLPPDRLEQWKREGTLALHHHAFDEERHLAYDFYEDSLRYDAYGTGFAQPALVFQGLRDRSVDPRAVEGFARTRPNVTLSLLDDDHQLHASLPRIWQDVAPFLGLAA
jgi:pimeloyl-ACP methyl ester carboxylesterase